MPPADPSRPPSLSPARGGLRELAGVFLKLGATAFGGPAVHLALLEDEAVRRRGWLTRAEFLDLLGVTNLIPGPNSTEMAIHLGLRRAGWRGLLVAGACFILPAFLITLACAAFYVRFASLPQLQGALYGVKPVVLAIVAQALWRLGRVACTTRAAAMVALVALVANLLGVHELVVLVVAGVAVPIARRVGPRPRPPAGRTSAGGGPPTTSTSSPGASVPPVAAIAAPTLLLGLGAPATTAPAGVGLVALFGFFAKVGAVLYGSGYVLIAFLRADLVDRWGWLSEAQLLDAIAVGQITPGPLFTTATFIGYVLAGGAGAVVATVGMFLPAFVFVALSAPFVPRLRQSPLAAAFLDGVNAASLALMGAATIQLVRGAMIDATTVGLALAAVVLLFLFRLNATWLILAAAVVGLATH
ncbi:MAG: chromate efflux transporter [Phycisphaerae bacterium]